MKRKSSGRSDRLANYRARRRLAESGEPDRSGRSGSRNSDTPPRFVIQKHAARQLHFDLRLEMDGVFRSWAVPKGLPAQPGRRSLAIEVEDHPIDYGDFEGTIPEGNYGAGTVMVWDRGFYAVDGTTPEKAHREGRIHLALVGEKCVGEWTLVRTREAADKQHWLLIKNKEPRRRAAIARRGRERSVLSGKTMQEIARDSPTAPVSRSRPGTRPNRRIPRQTAGFVRPMLALAVPEITREDLQLEIKYDGYRAVAVLRGTTTELWSRNEKSLTGSYPEIVDGLTELEMGSAVLDGEIVALDPKGRPSFQLMQNLAGPGRRPPIVYYVFDLLQIDGGSLLKLPLQERRSRLEELLTDPPSSIQLSPVFDVSPGDLLEEARRTGLEGIIGKDRQSPYEPGRRSGSWLKCRAANEQEFVIGGFTPPGGSRTGFGAIVVGYHEGKMLRYAGKVGTGFNTRSLRDLHQRFLRLKTGKCPFADLPREKRGRYGTGMTAAQMKTVTWLRPQLVAQIKFTEWTEDGSLRHPVFLGLREDKKPRNVVREAPAGSGT